MTGKVLTAPVPHKPVEENPSPSPAAARPMLNKEVKLDELSKYFHLPEKAVAKELGICLTSLVRYSPVCLRCNAGTDVAYG
eukprot:936678-Rhodomonas_salina.4